MNVKLKRRVFGERMEIEETLCASPFIGMTIDYGVDDAKVSDVIEVVGRSRYAIVVLEPLRKPFHTGNGKVMVFNPAKTEQELQMIQRHLDNGWVVSP